MATIGILNTPLHGHVIPANRLGAALVRRGHRVIAWAPERFRGMIEAAGAEHRVSPGRMGEEIRLAGRERVSVLTGPPGGPSSAFWDIVAARTQAGRAGTREVIEQLHAEGVELLVHDYMLVAGRIAGLWLGLPRVSSRSFYLQGVAGPFAPPDPPRPRTAEALEAARGAVARDWGIDLGGPMDLERNAGDVNVFHSTPEIAGFEPPDDSWRMVGPLLEDEVGVEPALDHDDGRPLVYVAFGTLFGGRREAFVAVLDALADEDVRVLVGAGGLRPDELAPVPANATVVGFANARAVLRDAAVFVTHGGTASVHEALAAGVPMVCLPLGADHWQWSRRVCDLGAGEMLGAIAPEALRSAVLRLLEDPDVRERAAALGARLRAYDGDSLAIDAIEGLL